MVTITGKGATPNCKRNQDDAADEVLMQLMTPPDLGFLQGGCIGVYLKTHMKLKFMQSIPATSTREWLTFCSTVNKSWYV